MTLRRPVPGRNVVTTIDYNIQKYCENALKKGARNGGAYVIMDIRTRELPPTLWAGDYENDPEFRQYIQSWVSQLWQDKDARIAELRQEL